MGEAGRILLLNASFVFEPDHKDSSGRGNSFHGSSFLREECLSSFVYVEEIAGAIVEKNGEPLKHCHNVIRDVCCPGGQIN
ncbi:unnamed protein product [Boreogadus saida]